MDTLFFDSRAYPEAERLDRYAATYARGADIRAAGPDFEAIVAATRLDEGLIYDRRLNDVIHERDIVRAAQDGFDHFTATAVLSGSFEVATCGDFRPVPVGAISLLAMFHPMSNRSRKAHVVTLSVAKNRLSPEAERLVGEQGLILDGAMAELFSKHLGLVAAMARDLEPAQARAVSDATFALLDATVDHRLQAPLSQRSDARNERLIRHYVETHLVDPDLSLAKIIEATGLSRATVYRELERWGGVSAYIRRRRLRRLAIDLADTKSPIEQLAVSLGFANAAHASRAFVDAYGMRPGAYRKHVEAGRLSGIPKPLMDAWMEEVLPTGR